MRFPRCSGILLHPTSLPGGYGIGDLGHEAYRMDWEEHTFELPDLSERRWCRVIDTMQMPPHDIAEPDIEAVLTDQRRYVVGPRSVVVLMGKMHEQSRDTTIYEKG